ncbi:hypothetical protein NQ317_018022 [Molorchus minor]|uniref:Uncharacterized protein n=1 Tax=Molorchus minor TaxID=1323400 RepID=A0ABQ9JUU3_9CUCU|nr:hypothetical protein NQ317_018022 [Molorchus minor]
MLLPPDSSYRDAEVIHRFYENKNKEVRKIAANEKTIDIDNQEKTDTAETYIYELNRNDDNEMPDFVLLETIETDNNNYYETFEDLGSSAVDAELTPLQNKEKATATKTVQDKVICSEPATQTSSAKQNTSRSRTSNINEDNWKKVTPKDLKKITSTPLRSIGDATDRKNLKKKASGNCCKGFDFIKHCRKI